MTVPVEEAIAHLLEWVNNGNPMPENDDDDDDLDNLYGGDTAVRVVDCHSEEEDNNRPSDISQQPKLVRRHPMEILTSIR